MLFANCKTFVCEIFVNGGKFLHVSITRSDSARGEIDTVFRLWYNDPVSFILYWDKRYYLWNNSRKK